MYETEFGSCDNCKIPLEADWFKDIEFKPKSNIPTGRVRRTVNYLYCPQCLKKFPVDESFDGQWYYERRAK